MMKLAPIPFAPFRTLQRTLVRRRLASLDLRLRIEIAAIGVIASAFFFWQARVRFASLHHQHGPASVAKELLFVWVVLAATAGALTMTRHLRRLRGGGSGPAWLALPITPHLLARHLAWESRLQALWVAPAAPGILVASVGLIPAWWIPILAAAFVWMVLEASRLGCTIAFRLALVDLEPRFGLPPIVRVLSAQTSSSRPGRSPATAPRRRRTRWRRLPAWLALAAKDWLLCRRATDARRRLWPPLAFGLLSLAIWGPFVPALGFEITPAAARAIGFGLALIAAATFGEWLIALSGEDPFSVLRGLPVGVRSIWLARASFAVGFTALLLTGQSLAGRVLGPKAHELFLVWTGAACLGILALALNYSLTLFPRAQAASRMLTLSLSLAIVASWMIPLMGWFVLVSAIIHSLRRLPRWTRLEEAR